MNLNSSLGVSSDFLAGLSMTPYSTFSAFLEDWDLQYKDEMKSVRLFCSEITKNLSKQQVNYFVKAFYHLRGHFHDFLWFIGNNAPNVEIKQIVTDNIMEEFGGQRRSHEHLYLDFASSAGVDMKPELLENLTNEPYIQDFNKGHLKWLHTHSWMHCLSAFAAYEHLDNVDYPALSALVASLGYSGKDVLFFKVHEHVEHFSPVRTILEESWSDYSSEIKEGFLFIGSHQISMWTNLAKRIFDGDIEGGCKPIT